MSSSGTTVTPNKTLPLSGSVQGSTATGANASLTDAVLGTTPRTVPRSQGGFSECFSGIKKEERATLKGMELEKLKKRAEEGLPSKFVLMKPVLKGDGSVDIERLKMIYPVSLRLREFLQELRVYDMEEVFVWIPSVFRVKWCLPVPRISERLGNSWSNYKVLQGRGPSSKWRGRTCNSNDY